MQPESHPSTAQGHHVGSSRRATLITSSSSVLLEINTRRKRGNKSNSATFFSAAPSSQRCFTGLCYRAPKLQELRRRHLFAAVAVMKTSSRRETRATGRDTFHHGCLMQQTPESNIAGTFRDGREGSTHQDTKTERQILKGCMCLNLSKSKWSG